MYKFISIILIVAALLLVQVQKAHLIKPRRIKFAACDEETPKPKAVFMSCANRKGVCRVIRGSAYMIRAIVEPEINGTSVDSYVGWNNSWFVIPLPNQDRDGCKYIKDCPVEAGKVFAFTYKLDIQDIWPQEMFPVKWTLTDNDTEEDIVCFRFRIFIN